MSQNDFRSAVLALVANSNLTIGQVKNHMKAESEGSENKVPTGKKFYRADIKSPKGFKLTIDGREVYTDNLTITVNAFNLYKTAPEAKAPETRPASLDGNMLDDIE